MGRFPAYTLSSLLDEDAELIRLLSTEAQDRDEGW
jgi:hypothetical protein